MRESLIGGAGFPIRGCDNDFRGEALKFPVLFQSFRAPFRARCIRLAFLNFIEFACALMQFRAKCIPFFFFVQNIE